MNKIAAQDGRFRVSDAMVLVAAMAPAFWLLRVAGRMGLFAYQKAPLGALAVNFLSLASAIVFGVLSVTVLGLGLRTPRGSIREVLARPGMVFCLAVLTGTVSPLIYAGAWLSAAWREPERYAGYDSQIFANAFGRLSSAAGPMILGAWLALVVLGRGRPGPDWTDRAGWMLGLGWVVVLVVSALYFRCCFLFA